MLEVISAAAPLPKPVVSRTAVTPMIMPNMVSPARILWAKMLVMATPKYLNSFMDQLSGVCGWCLGRRWFIVRRSGWRRAGPRPRCVADDLAVFDCHHPVCLVGNVQIVR